MKQKLHDLLVFTLIAVTFSAGARSCLNLALLNRPTDAGATKALMLSVLLLPILIHPHTNVWRRARCSYILFTVFLGLLLLSGWGVFPWLYDRLVILGICLFSFFVGACELSIYRHSAR